MKLLAHPLALLLSVGSPLFAQELVTTGGLINLQVPDGFTTAAAYNPDADEYLILYTAGSISNLRVFARRTNASNGAPIGAPIQVSGSFREARDARVAYNPHAQEYLVVWAWDLDTGSEIHGQRLDGFTAQEIGADDFAISDMGPPASTAYEAFEPELAFAPAQDEYLVVWSGLDDDGSSFGIYGQRLDASGAEVGADDFRISSPGTAVQATNPDVTWNPDSGEYLAVYRSHSMTPPVEEIRVQRLGATGLPAGPEQGISGLPAALWLVTPRVSYEPKSQRYLAAWNAFVGSPDFEFRILGQFLDGATAAETGPDDFEIAVDGGVGFDLALVPEKDVFQVAYNVYPAAAGTYAVLLDRVTGAQLGAPLTLTTDVGTARIAVRTGTGESALAWLEIGPEVAPGIFIEELLVRHLQVVCSDTHATVQSRVGTPPNPDVLQSDLAGPVVGTSWAPAIHHTTFEPTAVLDALAIGTMPVNQPTALGTLLCDPGHAVFFTVPASATFDVPVPDECAIVGAFVCAQGLSATASGVLSLTNALDMTIGAY